MQELRALFFNAKAQRTQSFAKRAAKNSKTQNGLKLNGNFIAEARSRSGAEKGYKGV